MKFGLTLKIRRILNDIISKLKQEKENLLKKFEKIIKFLIPEYNF